MKRLSSSGNSPNVSATITNGSTTNGAVKMDGTVRFLIEFSAGALGGAVSRTATAPIDRLRTVYQVKSVDFTHPSELSIRKLWSGMILEGKWHGLWRGNVVNVLKTAPENAIRLATYEKFKQILNEHRKGNGHQLHSFSDKIMCGSAAGLCATLALYPLKTVKTIMNMGQTGEFKSITDCINKLYRAHGMKAFYRGLLANTLAIMPSAGIDLATYETLKLKYSEYCHKSEPTVMERILLGNISSTIGNLVVYPLLFARTRLQSAKNLNETTCSLLLKVWKRDGPCGWYRGFLLHIAKIGPAASISYVVFETVNKSFALESLK
jgi:solute carrier family 25 phosphate transporter 23/24/25/41